MPVKCWLCLKLKARVNVNPERDPDCDPDRRRDEHDSSCAHLAFRLSGIKCALSYNWYCVRQAVTVEGTTVEGVIYSDHREDLTHLPFDFAQKES